MRSRGQSGVWREGPGITLRRRLSQHLVVLSIAFGVAASGMIFVGFQFFRPMLDSLEKDWVERELKAIRSIGGLISAVNTDRLMALFDCSAEQAVSLWLGVREHKEIAYSRLFNTVNAEIATVFRDGLTFADLPAPFRLEWDRSVYPPRILNHAAYASLQQVAGPRGQFSERRLMLYRESFGRMFPIGFLVVGFEKAPADLEAADAAAESCLGGQLLPGGVNIEGWPAGRVLSDDAPLVRYSYNMRDLVLYLADVRQGTDNLLGITIYNKNGMPFLSEQQTSPSFQFTSGLEIDSSLVRMSAHVRPRVGTQGTRRLDSGSAQAYDVFTPVFNHGALQGMIAFGLRGEASVLGPVRDTLFRVRAYMNRMTVALMAAMVLVSVLTAMRLRHHIALPLEAIAEASRDFVCGDPADPEHARRFQALCDMRHYSRESRRLCESYAHMVSTIQRTLKEKEETYVALALKEKQLFASQRQSLLGVVAAGVAHEIKNAMNPIKLRAERMLLAHEMGRDPGLREGLNLIVQSVGRCAELSNKLSAFAKPADIGSHFQFDLNETLRDALSMAHDALATAHVNVTTDLGEIPRIKGNPREMQQAIINFLLNGRDAIVDACKGGTRAGGNISVRTAVRDRFIEVGITDDGCGMSEDVKSNLFVPFFTTKEPGKGTGLGMGISQGILQAHGAELGVDSEPGRGTTITIRLPVAEATTASGAGAAGAKTAGAV